MEEIFVLVGPEAKRDPKQGKICLCGLNKICGILSKAMLELKTNIYCKILLLYFDCQINYIFYKSYFAIIFYCQLASFEFVHESCYCGQSASQSCNNHSLLLFTQTSVSNEKITKTW